MSPTIPTDSTEEGSNGTLGSGTDTWTLQYGDGSAVQGTKGYDNLTVGNLTAKHQLFGLADKISAQFATDPELDGIFGLGFARLSLMGTKRSFVENLKHQGVIKNAVASFYLGQSDRGGQLVRIIAHMTFSFMMINNSILYYSKCVIYIDLIYSLIHYI